MNKLPVGQTIIDAYGFTFTQLGTIIGLIWFPTVLSTLLSFLPQLAAGNASPDTITDADAFARLAVALLMTLLSAIAYVAVARQALGLRQGPAAFHFSLGMPEFRVYGALLILYFFMAILLLVPLEAERIGGAVSVIASYVALLVILLVLYLAVRIGSLLIPSVVAESKVDFTRLWLLTRGNFGRIVLVAAAIFIPLVVVYVAVAYGLISSDLRSVALVETSDPKVLAQQVSALQDVFMRHTPELMGVGLIMTPFAVGLALAASASAYRTLSGALGGPRAIVA